LNVGKTVLAQLTGLLTMFKFFQCVERCNGTFKVKSFSFRDWFLCMNFAQLIFLEGVAMTEGGPVAKRTTTNR